MTTKQKESLKNAIAKTKTSEELENLIDSIPKQDNGEKQQIARILDDAFWYINIETLEQQKNFMFKKLD